MGMLLQFVATGQSSGDHRQSSQYCMFVTADADVPCLQLERTTEGMVIRVKKLILCYLTLSGRKLAVPKHRLRSGRNKA
jgi:hypothetical protein